MAELQSPESGAPNRTMTIIFIAIIVALGVLVVARSEIDGQCTAKRYVETVTGPADADSSLACQIADLIG